MYAGCVVFRATVFLVVLKGSQKDNHHFGGGGQPQQRHAHILPNLGVMDG